MPKLPARQPKRPRRGIVRVGVDAGGTFTDFIYSIGNEIRIFKLPSTPHDPSRAVLEGVRRICSELQLAPDEIEVVHGTTVGTNALLERRGARVAFVTTHGFEDLLIIGRQARPHLYDLNVTRPQPLVADGLSLGVRERTAADGTTLEPLDDDQVKEIVRRLREAKVEAVAVCLLFSFANPAHERKIAAALSALGVPLSVSHRILPEYREYERASTTVANAYLQPLMSRYIERLGRDVPRLRIMQSSGGSIGAETAATEPVRTVLSGPAGGVVGALHVARPIGARDIITFDMGGTSTDVALCADGEVHTTREMVVSGIPIAIPCFEIHTVGAGGGSVARVDRGGSLRVGPESAGADPGPACYGKSDLPTVTDANLVLGRFGDGALLGGAFPLDVGRARSAIEALARELSAAASRKVSVEEAALGILRVVNANMERAIRAVSVERGHDPRRFTLVTFGGAGGLHAVALARALRIPRVIVPRDPGALSAFGVLAADVVRDQTRTVMLCEERFADIEALFRELEEQNARALEREGFVRQKHTRFLAARYRGQSFELELRWRPKMNPAKTFHRAHEMRYGYARRGSPVEIVSVRVRSVGIVEKIAEQKAKRMRARRASAQRVNVIFDDGARPCNLYRREDLSPGARLVAPCIVTEYSSTTLIPAGARAYVDRFGNLVIEP